MGKQRHKLVCLGDSLTQGFQNSCIYRTDLSYPALLMRALDYKAPFDQYGFTARGGIPLNVELLVRSLEDKYGADFSTREFPSAAAYIFSMLKYIKNYWDGNVRSLADPHQTTPCHNQSVWGMAINDAWMLTDEKATRYMEDNPPKYSVFSFLPDHAMYVTAKCVLNPSESDEFRNYSMLDNVAWLDRNGGIENLIVYLGSNHIISAAARLELSYSTDSEVEALPHEREYTVMRPDHFEQNFNKLAEQINRLNPGRIFTATIPYITLLPIMQPVFEIKSGTREYADFYTHFWVDADFFDPGQHPHLTREQAIELDLTIDRYNAIIRSVAEKYGWTVVPVGRLVYAASGRNPQKHKQPYSKAFIDALKRNDRTRHLVVDDVIELTTDLPLADDEGKLSNGGLISLDGIHPTTTAYGHFAELFMNVMQEKGVSFKYDFDWDRIIKEDELVTHTPKILEQFRQVQYSMMKVYQGFFRESGRRFGTKELLTSFDRVISYLKKQGR